MTIPKQDERTPGRFASGPSGDFDYPFSITENDGLVFALVNDGARAAQIVKSLNAYGSTDALRSALAKIADWPDGGNNYGQSHIKAFARAALSGSPAPSTDGLREWQPIETAPHDDYRTILVVVEAPDGDLTHRLAMWEPENDDWTVFMANWNPQPLFWMPLPPAPDAARTALAPEVRE